MCLTISQVARTYPYNWAGDQIVSPLVRAARTIPGRRSKGELEMDVREFLAIEHSAEVRRFYRAEVIDRQPVSQVMRLFVGGAGNFDFRMRCAIECFSKFKYEKLQGKGREQWLLPAETLANGGGDCEDLAFLLCALLEETGISRSCLRVAFGSLVEKSSKGKDTRHDHAWVMYQMESGAWIVLDPVERCAQAANQHRRAAEATGTAPRAPLPKRGTTFEYQPRFVLNRDHLWRVHDPRGSKHNEELREYVEGRTDLDSFDPSFALGVHNGLFDTVMGKHLSWLDLFTVKTASLGLDIALHSYDPRDHCDFAYIDESWARIDQRLATGSVSDLGRACHTIADFYAHTLYAHVVAPVGSLLPLYDRAKPPALGSKQDPVFNRQHFPINNDEPLLTDTETKQHFRSHLISGQWWRNYAAYPNDIQTPAILDPRRCLPDHDYLAVDDLVTKDDPTHLYPTATAYNAQFTLRQSAAQRHIAETFERWQKQHGK